MNSPENGRGKDDRAALRADEATRSAGKREAHLYPQTKSSKGEAE